MGIDVLLALVIGILLGAVFRSVFIHKPKPAGYLNIVESNEPDEDPYLFLDPDITVQEMRKEEYVIFKISQK